MPTLNKIKKCSLCGSRLSGKHHFFCDSCWDKRHIQKLKEKAKARVKK